MALAPSPSGGAPIQHTEMMEKALRNAGVPVEAVYYPTEGHGLLRVGPQLHFYRRLERFLDWYLM